MFKNPAPISGKHIGNKLSALLGATILQYIHTFCWKNISRPNILIISWYFLKTLDIYKFVFQELSSFTKCLIDSAYRDSLTCVSLETHPNLVDMVPTNESRSYGTFSFHKKVCRMLRFSFAYIVCYFIGFVYVLSLIVD